MHGAKRSEVGAKRCRIRHSLRRTPDERHVASRSHDFGDALGDKDRLDVEDISEVRDEMCECELCAAYAGRVRIDGDPQATHAAQPR